MLNTVSLELDSKGKTLYRIRSIFGGDFNLAVWRFFVRPPNLNDANIASLLLFV